MSEDHRTELRRAVEFLGGVWVDPTKCWATRAGFGHYLAAVGVEFFDAAEVTTPHQRDVAMRLGYGMLLPAQSWWPRGAACLLLADQLRRLVDEPIWAVNWYRPEAYNKAVGGAPKSDHVTAHAVDLRFRTEASRIQAEAHLDELDRDEPWLQLSLGLQGHVGLQIHVGIMSPGGRRRWQYGK